MKPPAHWQSAGNGVFRDSNPIVSVSDSDIAFLGDALASNANGRVRLCAHAGSDAPVHEMLIALTPFTYVRPHRHFGKSESFHMIDGEVEVVIFSVEGKISSVISLGSYGRDRTFYYRLSTDLFHTVLVNSSRAVFHETTNGPFVREETQYAEWAPDAAALDMVSAYQESLHAQVAAWRTVHQA